MGSTMESGQPYDLDDQLAICAQVYEIDRDTYWKGRPEGADWELRTRLCGHADRVAAILLSDTDILTDQRSYEERSEQFAEERRGYLGEMQDEISSFMRLIREKLPQGTPLAAFDQYVTHQAQNQRPPEDSLLKLVWERLCIDLAKDFADTRLVVGANRILLLSELLLDEQPSNATVRFLRRISRCFIWGFDAECVILCRGAIDTAFMVAVSDEICDKHGLKKAKYGHTLANRIKAAKLEGIIDERTKKVAFRVNEPATEAAHTNPDNVMDVLQTLRDTRDVLNRLHSRT